MTLVGWTSAVVGDGVLVRTPEIVSSIGGGKMDIDDDDDFCQLVIVTFSSNKKIYLV